MGPQAVPIWSVLWLRMKTALLDVRLAANTPEVFSIMPDKGSPSPREVSEELKIHQHQIGNVTKFYTGV
jgi:hypothetical protein